MPMATGGVGIHQEDSHDTHDGTSFSIFNNTYFGDDTMFIIMGTLAFLLALCYCRHNLFSCLKSVECAK